MRKSSVRRVGYLTQAGALVIAVGVLWASPVQALSAKGGEGLHRTWANQSDLSSHSTGRSSTSQQRITLQSIKAIDNRLRAIGVDPARAVFEQGARNYAGDRCPGRGWTCASTASPVVQIARTGGSNRADCSARHSCVVLQADWGHAADNVAFCVKFVGTTQSCSITQSNSTGGNSALAVEVAIGLGATQSSTQTISITQTNDSGDNDASVLQATALAAFARGAAPVNQSLNADESIDITQNTTTGNNDVHGPICSSPLAQSQTLAEDATSHAGITQEENGLSSGPNMSIDVEQNQATPSASGTNSSSFDQKSTLTTTAVTPTGPVAQTESSTTGGLAATVNQLSTGLSTSSVKQSEHQFEAASTTPDGATLPPDTTQTEVGPVRCCSLQQSNSGDTFSIAQSTVQCAGTPLGICSTGTNPGSNQTNEVDGMCQTSGNCTLGQSIDVDGVTTTSSKSGPTVSQTTTCTGDSCTTGEDPTAAIGPVCVNGLTVALNGAIDWQDESPGSISFDWGDGSSSGSSFPNAHTYAEPGSYKITVTGMDDEGSGSASTSVTVSPSTSTCTYYYTPSPPIAASGSLEMGGSVGFALEVDQNGKPLDDAPVWLSFAPAEDGGTASGCCFDSDEQTSLTGSPQVFVTGVDGSESGQVQLTYTATDDCASGTDTVQATDDPNSETPGVSISDSYTYDYDEDCG